MLPDYRARRLAFVGKGVRALDAADAPVGVGRAFGTHESLEGLVAHAVRLAAHVGDPRAVRIRQFGREVVEAIAVERVGPDLAPSDGHAGNRRPAHGPVDDIHS